MNVNQLRDRILTLAHDEASPDTTMKQNALEWLNQAYHELIDEVLPYLTRYLQQEETVTTDSNGQASLSQDVYRIVQLVDTSNSKSLIEKRKSDILTFDADLSQTGQPLRYWVAGDTVTVHPKMVVNLTVVYLPLVSDLVEDGAESTILLPKSFHHGLIWGGLVWASTYERGFSAQGDLVLFQRKWEEFKQQMKLSLNSAGESISVKAYELA